MGSTGFVGSNLYDSGAFDKGFHSSDIEKAYGLKPDLLVYAGLRAEKYLANQAPKKDRALILQAQETIERIAPRRLVLISTIDVLKDPKGADETVQASEKELQAYGYNRLCLERWVREYDSQAMIVRLPGLFGKNIKKNFIYDYIHVIPFMLRADKLEELKKQAPELSAFYELQENGFYRHRETGREQQRRLRAVFKSLGFTALNFTDSRSRYQFYPLSRLWEDIQVGLEHGIRLWHPATEPVSAAELYKYLTGKEFVNELSGIPADYDYRTVYDHLYGGRNGYICAKDVVKEEIRRFVREEEGRL